MIRRRLGSVNGADVATPKTHEDVRTDYFGKRQVQFIPSGCMLLDCVLGGGWPLGRISNIVGDKAVGKTLLAIEAAANFHRLHPEGHIWYREAEAAFDTDYASTLGLPVEDVDFGDQSWETIEDIFEDMSRCIKQAQKSDRPGLYIVDSLDALSSRAEMDRDVEKGSFGLEKQKKLGELFRRHVRALHNTKICVLIISQIRDKIGAMFGDKHTRSGGRALDFYASIILYLSHLQTVKQTVSNVKRATAVRIKAQAKKNKITLPFRDCEFTIRFGFGVDDLAASLQFLKETNRLSLIKFTGNIKPYLDESDELSPEAYQKRLDRVNKAVLKAWFEIEDRFKPARSKYGVQEQADA